jgi:23S rRNA (adenine1618-N6)-methyltransferase
VFCRLSFFIKKITLKRKPSYHNMPKPKPKGPAKAIPQNEDKVESKNKVKTAEEREADRKDKKEKTKKVTPKKKKQGFHEKNPFHGRYDFDVLVKKTPELGAFVHENEHGVTTIDFSDAEAVKLLNKALLHAQYEIEHWDIPKGYLCPPVPGRADYLHHVADLLKESNKGKLPNGKAVKVLDIGTGANCIYPIIGNRTFEWKFVGSEVDPLAVKSATQIVSSNRNVAKSIEIRTQEIVTNILNGVIYPNDVFDLTVCNPPFFKSLEQAAGSNKRKQKNLGIKSSHNALNFGGQNTEFWTKGGEKVFIQKMIKQSAQFTTQCLWFTSLVSNIRNLPYLEKCLEQANVIRVKVIEISQGQKTSRILCWSFLSKNEQKKWADRRWKS